jgi:hypothetical protein
MKKIILGIAMVGLLLGGCETVKTVANNTITKTGVLQAKTGSDYLLNTDSGIVEITSTKINFDNYLKKKISVTGMFSGSILYVDTVN